MEWYEILGLIFFLFLGVLIGIKVSEYYKHRHFNDSWKNRDK